jgi:hypothetical protein
MVAFDAEDIMWRYNTGYEGYANWLSPQGLSDVAIADKYFELFHRHKITLIGENDCVPPTPDQPCTSSMPRLNGSLFTAANGYDGPGVSTPTDVFSIGTYGTWSWKTEGEPGMWTHADNWVNWFQQNVPNIDYFIYLEDEPPPSDYAQVNTWAQWIHDDPGPGHNLRSMSTTYAVIAQAYMPYLNIPNTLATWGICLDNILPCANTAINETAADFYRTMPGDKLWAYNGTDIAGLPSENPFAHSFRFLRIGVRNPVRGATR